MMSVMGSVRGTAGEMAEVRVSQWWSKADFDGGGATTAM
jgi:hypothetical protein